MAKVQKTLLLHADLWKLIEQQQMKTNASIASILSAALIQYLLSNPSGPSTVWNRLLFDLNKGNKTIEEIAAEAAKVKSR